MRCASLALLALTLSACSTMRASILPPRPGNLRLIRKSALRPFAGGKSLLLLEQLVVGDEEEADSIVIPASWVIGTVFEGVHP